MGANAVGRRGGGGTLVDGAWQQVRRSIGRGEGAFEHAGRAIARKVCGLENAKGKA